jgi:hypothetical protein
MKQTHDGLTLTYDPPGVVMPRNASGKGVSVTATLEPASPNNVVCVQYRIDGGPVQDLRAVAERIDYQRNLQYFRATFPRLKPGQSIDYRLFGTCAGRRVPGTATDGLEQSFRVSDDEDRDVSGRSDRPTPLSGDARSRYALGGDFVARVTIAIEPPRIVGPTPDGIRVTWNAGRGSVDGPLLKATVLQAADWMRIRPDGVGDVDVQAVLETGDGAKIMASYSGIIEFGEDGYQRFLTNTLPASLKVWTAPRFLTAAAAYTWLNRLQCVGVGEVRLDEMTYVYDLYKLTW